MTTNIVKVAKSINDSLANEISLNSPKYGDDDLSSKRRKPAGNDDDDDDDEYNTMFTKRLTDASVSQLNSTSDSQHDISCTPERNLDFKGGPIASVKSLAKCNSTENEDETNLLNSSISQNPSDSSFGFQNTFTVLERQLHLNKQPILNPTQIEYILKRNPSEAVKNPIYVDVPINAETYLRAVSSKANSLFEDACSSGCENVDSPSLFELEIEAMQRCKQLLATHATFELVNESGSGSSSTGPVAMKTIAEQQIHTSLIEDFYQQDGGDYSEYVYHVAKAKDGHLYLRVVRSLLVDKVLCGNRVSQMTRAYDDIEAVTRLLEEKEKDLELTVQIGKELLAQNTRLENRVVELEGELKTANENLAQLSHELHKKSFLLAALTNDEDGGTSEDSTPVAAKPFNLDLLQKKITNLEDENKQLRTEVSQIAKETDEVEEQERRLMADITHQLNSANYQYDGLSLELERHKEENKLQHEQIVNLSAKLAEAEIRLHQLTSENEEQISRLSITEENQNLLAAELAEFKARYQEVLSLLQETQEQLRRQRKRAQPTVRSNLIPGIASLACPPGESLHSELMETSLFSDNSLDSGIASDRSAIGIPGHMPGYKKVFETVRCATKAGHYADSITSSQIGAMSMSSSSQPRMSSYAGCNSTQLYNDRSSSIYSGSMYESSLGAKSFSRESLASDSEDSYPGKPSTGIPGAPGAKDLEAALKRLTPTEVLVRRTMLSNAPPGTYSYDESTNAARHGIRTPDSIMSTGSSGLSCLSSNHWRLPEKLQIVKPMEGSQTLHHWNRLATPTLGGLLDERPGVTIRGGRGLDELGLQMYSLSDVEEDEAENPGKQYQTYSSIYTYTNSTVMHPDDGMSMTSSLPQSQMSSRIDSISSSRQPSAPSTPRQGLSRRNSCSTFSVSTGLASMLNERGIMAVTPSALNTPAGPNYSPTVTPCNSPEGSPPRENSPEPPLLTGLFYSGADIIRRKFIGAPSESPERKSRLPSRSKILLSRQEKRALRSLRLVEKVESIGLDNIIYSSHNQSIGISPLALGSVRSRTSSPMTQLTSFKNIPHQRTHSATRSDDLYAVDRDTIRAVLNKGLSNESLSSAISTEGSTTSSITNHGDDLNKPNKKPAHQAALTNSGSGNTTIITDDITRTPQKTDSRIKQMQRQKSRRSLMNGAGGQRPDLGTVGGVAARNDNGAKTRQTKVIRRNQSISVDDDDKSDISSAPQQTITQSFVGTISSLFFGRKGGLL